MAVRSGLKSIFVSACRLGGWRHGTILHQEYETVERPPVETVSDLEVDLDDSP